jgi:Restriction endonuclease
VSTKMTATEYELLTQRLMRLISERSPLQTTRLEHDIKLTGRSGLNQIDVIWEFLTPDGSPRRVIVECRNYQSQLKRQAVFAWRGVVDDLDSPDMPTLGVMVTVTGYQSGAQRVADTYGVVILHLREPTDQDVERRLMEIRVLPIIRIPYIGPDVHMEATQELAELPPGPIDACDCELLRADGSTVPLTDFLWSGELRGFNEPAVTPHRITRAFTPPVTLLLDGMRASRLPLCRPR